MSPLNANNTAHASRSFKGRNLRRARTAPFVGDRKAAACVEMAIVLPVMFLITLGTLETCEGLFLLQKIEIAAHEGARAAIRKQATDDDVESAVGLYLDARGITYQNIRTVVTADPSPQLANELEPIRISVTIPTAGNFRMPTNFYRFWTGPSVSADVVMFKEFEPPRGNSP